MKGVNTRIGLMRKGIKKKKQKGDVPLPYSCRDSISPKIGSACRKQGVSFDIQKKTATAL